MYQFHLSKMATDIINAGLVSEEKRPELMEALNFEWKDKIADSWAVEDVLWQADQMGVKITNQQAVDVLKAMLCKMDCNIGLNWDVMRVCIEEELENA